MVDVELIQVGLPKAVRHNVDRAELPVREEAIVVAGANDSYVEEEEHLITSLHCHP
jgi:hypothetical protein